ncbi:hypothetical protein O181_091885 [Austropuccinia psidii MF-1]|uniref:Reverse transcriptase Ty1/copia-type domain-containing protein n=1 Tax=Austropuccinia psidii MF-1 TaxID=1389203 RepID=A0A9Q3P8J7_9BASI|nr:hypothetical protein [Austropuccinia psidii MF-1]
MNSPDRAQWRTAIEEELRNMNDIAPLPIGQHVLGGSWVFVKKAATQSSAMRFKACYVARGNRQAENEFELTFAPTATFTLLQMLLTIVSLRKWHSMAQNRPGTVGETVLQVGYDTWDTTRVTSTRACTYMNLTKGEFGYMSMTELLLRRTQIC